MDAETNAGASDCRLLAVLRAGPRGAYGGNRRCGTPTGIAGGEGALGEMPTAPRETYHETYPQNERTTPP